MSDGLPTDEQLRRIARGVQHRIDRRRRIAQRVAGATAAVALLGGGIALVAPFVGGAGASGGSAAGTAASGTSTEVVRCHASSARSSATTLETVPAGAVPDAIAAACGAVVEFQSGAGRVPTRATTAAPEGASSGSAPADQAAPASSARPAVVCRADDGALHVFPADGRPSSLCVRDGMRPA